jgi:hypothetical protein
MLNQYMDTNPFKRRAPTATVKNNNSIGMMNAGEGLRDFIMVDDQRIKGVGDNNSSFHSFKGPSHVNLSLLLCLSITL